MPDRGTPQGAVLSPMLFNLTLIPNARTLPTVPTLRSTLYAAEIAILIHSGSDQHIKATLQHGLNQITRPTLQHVKKYVNQTTHLIRRIATKHHVIKEQDRRRLVHSFLLNHTACLTSTFTTQHANSYRCSRIVLELRESWDMWWASIDTHHMSQLTHLASSPTGHYILNFINILPPTSQIPPLPIPPHIHNRIRVYPIPRQMHPTFHASRRPARANTKTKLYPPSPSKLYSDATPYPHKPEHCLTVLGKHPPPNVTAATILTTNTTTTEGAAIALALGQDPTPQFVLSGSQQAIRHFIRGNISPMAFRILANNPPSDTVTLLWTPAHTSVCANEMVHDRARELIDRATISTALTRDFPAGKPTSLLQFGDITLRYRLLRRQYPLPHPHLSQEAAHMLRLLQTHTFPRRTQLVLTHPHLFTTPPVLPAGHSTLTTIPFANATQTHTPIFPPLTSGSRCCATRRSQAKSRPPPGHWRSRRPCGPSPPPIPDSRRPIKFPPPGQWDPCLSTR
ncbi:hypothetical protein HPB47_021060 [Ixodes persulcatus]|uniref:Uncharacterized protein n=1 Tax=Ixodes persulcatus TaxID=34615 RepID=A0AC60QDQ7_IXOPE|nr:hypothetical protein HPB47_021060 [Ixodes persulcatus]